ncbi:hypothetical protein LINPERHAP1_LOCUS39398 [Linum perenne]
MGSTPPLSFIIGSVPPWPGPPILCFAFSLSAKHTPHHLSYFANYN